MKEEQIIEIFVRAAEVERKLPGSGRPGTDKAINYGYVHDTADINGWFSEDKEALRWAWLDAKNLRATTNDVGLWEAAMEMMKLVRNPTQRRALWAWAKAEAGGQAFAKWCRSEGISRQLGDWRKSAGIACIERAFDRKALQHNEKSDEPDFTNQAETGDKKPIITVWRPDGSKPVCGFDEDLRDFSWAEAQNARRRAREAKRREAA